MKNLRQKYVFILFGLWSLCAIAQPNANSVSENSQALVKIAQHLSQDGTVDRTNILLNQLGYTKPANINDIAWEKFPAIRKLETAFLSASQRGNALQGQRFLAMLSQALAMKYESVNYDKELVPFLKVETSASIQFDNSVFRDNNLNVNFDAATVPLKERNAISRISKYTSSGALGGTHSVMLDYLNLPEAKVYNILRNSVDEHAAILEAARTAGEPPPLKSRLQNIIADLGTVYESVGEDPILSKYATKQESVVKEYSAHQNNKATVQAYNYKKKYDWYEAEAERKLKLEYDENFGAKSNGLPTSTSTIKPPYKPKSYKNMINGHDWGGILLGGTIKYNAHYKIKKVQWIAANEGKIDSSAKASGRLEFVLQDNLDKNKLLNINLSTVLAEDIYTIYQLIYSENRKDQGMGLASVEFKDIVRDNLYYADILLHPSLVNSTLGWDLTVCDILPNQQAILRNYFKDKGDLENAKLQKYFDAPFHGGWKITDAGVDIKVVGNTFDVSRQDEIENSLRKCYIKLMRFKGDSMWDIDQGGTVRVREFDQILPVLITSVPEYKRLNQFIKILSLIRLAKSHNAPFYNRPNRVSSANTPYVLFAREIAGFSNYQLQAFAAKPSDEQRIWSISGSLRPDHMYLPDSLIPKNFKLYSANIRKSLDSNWVYLEKYYHIKDFAKENNFPYSAQKAIFDLREEAYTNYLTKVLNKDSLQVYQELVREQVEVEFKDYYGFINNPVPETSLKIYKRKTAIRKLASDKDPSGYQSMERAFNTLVSPLQRELTRQHKLKRDFMENTL